MQPAPRSGRLISGLRTQSPAPLPAHRAQPVPVTHSPTGPPQEAAPSSPDCSPALGNTGNAGNAAQRGRPGHRGLSAENEAACRGEVPGPREHHGFTPGHSKVLPRPQALEWAAGDGQGLSAGVHGRPWPLLGSPAFLGHFPSSSSTEATKCLLSTQALQAPLRALEPSLRHPCRSQSEPAGPCWAPMALTRTPPPGLGPRSRNVREQPGGVERKDPTGLAPGSSACAST